MENREKAEPVLVMEGAFPAYRIRPRDIDTSGVSLRGFGKFEIEESALVLVKFFQVTNIWEKFFPEEFLKFAEKLGHTRGLYGLFGAWENDDYFFSIVQPPVYLVYLHSGELCVTEEFIKRASQSEVQKAVV